MGIQAGTRIIAQVIAVPGGGKDQLQNLKQREMEMHVQVSDIEVQLGQLITQQNGLLGDAARRLDKPIAKAQHDLTVARVNLEATRERIDALQHEQQTYVALPPQLPGPTPPLNDTQIITIISGSFLLMLPIVFAFTRRLWVRGIPRSAAALDADTSARLLRIEEAVESIAIEVERIGEGQRFTTKLLSERQADASGQIVPSSAPVARREPGVITPH